MRILIAANNTRQTDRLIRSLKKARCISDHFNDLTPEEAPSMLTGNDYACIITDDCALSHAFTKTAKPENTAIIQLDPDQEIDLADIFAETAAAHGHDKSHILEASGFKLNMLNPALQINGTDVSLRFKAYALLRLLMLHKNTLVSHDHIANALYGDEIPMSVKNNVNVNLSRTRKAVRDAGGDASVIETIGKENLMFRDEQSGVNIEIERGPIKIFANGYSAYNGQMFRLQARELLLLKLIMQHPNLVLNREHIRNHFYASTHGADQPEEDLSKVYACLLRASLAKISKSERAPYGENVIRTVRGIGYQWQDPEPLPAPRGQTPPLLELAA